MAHSEKCPVCGGSGTITPNNDGRTVMPLTEACRGCNGKGWVEVSDNQGYWPKEPPCTLWFMERIY